MSWLDWLSLASICLLGAMSPGPSLAVVVRHTLAGGSGAGIQVGLAHGFGIALYAVAVVSGLGLLITTSPLLFQGLQWAGALFLAYLGIQSLRSAAQENEPDEVEAGRGEPSGGTPLGGNPLVHGFTVALFNPKVAIFFLALFSQFLDPEASLPEKAGMVTLIGSVDAAWYCAVSAMLGNRRLLPRLQAARRPIDRVFGVILLLLALRIVFAALGGQ
ncbi:MAG: LysE family translocator [Halieaceae bacterium]|nr:LysE family translocator [Halieaceae bacterium]